MAKVKAPLLSFGASGAIGETLVYFPWKGLNAVRSWVKPANPNTAAQSTQRGYMTTIVALIHTAMALAADPLATLDIAAYSLLASCESTPRTWFNQVAKIGVEQYKAAKKAAIFRDGLATPGVGQVALTVKWTKDGANDVTAGNYYWGTSKTALFNVEAAVVAAGEATATVLGLAAGQKYFFKFVPTLHADFLGTESGIYYATPT